MHHERGGLEDARSPAKLALLSREEMAEGKVPTTPTTSSVIAGIEAQEAVKMLHGMETLSGQGFVFDGTWHQSYIVNYSRREDCPAHDAYAPITELPWSVATTKVGDFLEKVQSDLGRGAVIEFNHELLESLTCPQCQETEPHLASLGHVTEKAGLCPGCGSPRAPNLYHTVRSQSHLLDYKLSELGVPLWDVLAGRNGMNQAYYEFTGDRHQVLGPLMGGQATS